jgi:crossover junction endodeoxyribonuclease RusA
MTLLVPYPPSVNTYWRHVGRTVLVSAKGRAYRQNICAAIPPMQPLLGRVEIKIDVYPPDNRRRDLDNVLKALLDGLRAAGVYADDSQIDHLDVLRCVVFPGGKCVVELSEIPS